MVRYWITLCLLYPLLANGANYYVATNGVDTNDGSEGNPWLTIQKGITTAQPGDTILVGTGYYTNNVISVRHGTNNPIILDGQGVASMQYMALSHSNYVIRNMQFMTTNAGQYLLYMRTNADGCVISNNVFDAKGSLSAKPLHWESIPTNSPFGKAGSDNLVISNVFKNGAGEAFAITMYGDRNLFVGNVMRDGDTIDFLRIYGRSNTIRGNIFSNCWVTGISGHPDLFQLSGTPNGPGAYHILIEQNVFRKFAPGSGGAISQIAGGDVPEINDIEWRNNLFCDIGSKATIAARDVRFYNNTFFRCSTNTETVLNWTVGTNATFTNYVVYSGHGGQCFNNVFLDCGGPLTNLGIGFYTFYTGVTNGRADHNFVAKHYGPVLIDEDHYEIGDTNKWNYGAWWEPNGINGGNPLFTSEGGRDFRVTADSFLYNAGTNLASLGFTNDILGNPRPADYWTIGAYEAGIPAAYPDLPCRPGPKTIRAYVLATGSSNLIYWPSNEYRHQLHIARRVYTNRPSAWQTWTNVYADSDPATASLASKFSDTAVSSGLSYEYRIASWITNYDCNPVYTGVPYCYYQYLNTGTLLPLTDTRGNVVLLVESGVAALLGTELGTLTNDLVGDGYAVFRHDVAAVDVTEAGWFAAVTNTKALIRADYNTDTNSDWTIFIVGHVPIPYSGWGTSNPGGHTNNAGAHPADWFFADMSDNTNWTDTSITDETGEFEAQHNVPGDGKFDQFNIPTAPEMRIGRIDFRNMPAFAKTEVELLSQYLIRNHAWRHRQFSVRSLGLVNSNNNAGLIYRGLPHEAHDVLSSLFGTAWNDTVILGSWLNDAASSNNSYLLAYSLGNGEYARDYQVGYTTNFADTNLYAVFTKMYGSYYGDWDSSVITNCVLLAPLASSGYTLANTFSEGIMNLGVAAIGEPIGFESYLQTASGFGATSTCYYSYGLTNALYKPTYRGYVTLMGDPTLKIFQVTPPTNAVATTNGNDIELSWGASADATAGYHVYRAPANDLNSFTRLTTTPIASVSYTNTDGATSAYTYMVRAVKLEDSAQRSFYNASQGIFATTEAGEAPPATNTLQKVTLRGARVTTRGGVTFR